MLIFFSFFSPQSLVACLGGAFLGGVIARMAKDYRHCRGGLPDLVVWNSSNNSYKVRSPAILACFVLCFLWNQEIFGAQ